MGQVVAPRQGNRRRFSLTGNGGFWAGDASRCAGGCSAFRLALLVLLSVFVLTAGVQAEPYHAKIGVWAGEGPEAAQARWGVTVQYLNNTVSDATFVLVPLGYDDLIDQVARRALDFVIIDPGLEVKLEARQDIEAIATLQNTFKGQSYALAGATVFCKAGRIDLSSPSDLRGKLLGTTSERSLEEWVSVVRELRLAGIDAAKDIEPPLFLNRADAVVAGVLDGSLDAGCVRSGTLEAMAAAHKLDLASVRVLTLNPDTGRDHVPVAASTRLYPEWYFAACDRTPDDIAKRVAAALLTMSTRFPQVVDRPYLLGWTSPRSDVAVHEVFKELRIPPYEHFGDISFTAVVREYMYWFIAAGTAMLVMLIVILYVTALNRALFAEITERKRAEASLRESVTRFENIASCSADWIWEADADGRYTYSSSIVHQMLGYTPDEVVGKHHADLFAKAERERMRTQGQTALSGGARLFRERYRLLTKDGRVVIHETTAEPVINGDGRCVGYRGVNRDVTSQVRFVRLRQ